MLKLSLVLILWSTLSQVITSQRFYDLDSNSATGYGGFEIVQRADGSYQQAYPFSLENLYPGDFGPLIYCTTSTGVRVPRLIEYYSDDKMTYQQKDYDYISCFQQADKDLDQDIDLYDWYLEQDEIIPTRMTGPF